jgi:membrane protease YdiL (CAAX protease family)
MLQEKLLPFLLPLVFFWLIPFVVTTKIEKQKLKKLGITYKENKTTMYIKNSILGFLALTSFLLLEHYIRIQFIGELPNAIHIQNQNPLNALLLQIIGIGLPEEIFFRGYLFTNLSIWLGKRKGLIISSLLFGVGHFTSRVFQHGSMYIFSAFTIGIQTLLAGLVLGYLFNKTESIFPPAASHILLNLFGPVISARVII